MNLERRFLVPAVMTAFVFVACSGGSVPTSVPAVTASPVASTPSVATESTRSTPSAAVVSTRSPARTLVPLATNLEGQWITAPHQIPLLAPDANAALISLRPAAFSFTAQIEDNGGSEVLDSTAETLSDGTVRLALKQDQAGCLAGEAGTYEMQPSSTGLTLATKALHDDCPARLAAVANTTWSRLACPHAPQWCLGDMEAGEHVSINYEPFVRRPDWKPDYGRFGFTVPAGWVTTEDNPDGYVLQPSGAAEGTGVYVFSDVLAHAQGRDCPVRQATKVGTSAAAIAAWIQSLPGLDVTAVNPHATVGGLAGWSFDLGLKRTWTGTCEWANGEPLVELFLNAQTTPQDGFEWGLNGTGRQRLFVLELGPDRALVIDIEAGDTASWNQLLPTAVPIVRSFAFRH